MSVKMLLVWSGRGFVSVWDGVAWLENLFA
jgi:hypothetical protein